MYVSALNCILHTVAYMHSLISVDPINSLQIGQTFGLLREHRVWTGLPSCNLKC